MAKYLYCTIQALRGKMPAVDEGKTPCIEVDLQVTECDADPSRVGQVFTEYIYLSTAQGDNHDKSREINIAKLRALGWSCNDITELTGLGGISAQGGIYSETWKGVTREKMAIWKKDPPRASVEGADKAKFAKMFKASAAAVGVVKVSDFNAPVDREGLPEERAKQVVEKIADVFGPTEDEIPF